MFFRLLLRYLKERDRWQGEIWIPRKKGNLCRHWVNISALKNIKGETIQFTAIFKGKSGQHFPGRNSSFIPNYDCLTGLPNRIHFHEHLQAVLERQEDPNVAVLFLDLDRLKTINDTLGYGIGDLILQLAAERLVRNVPEGSMVARMGGDEFIILLEKITGTTDAIYVSQMLLKELLKPFNWSCYTGTGVMVCRVTCLASRCLQKNLLGFLRNSVLTGGLLLNELVDQIWE